MIRTAIRQSRRAATERTGILFNQSQSTIQVSGLSKFRSFCCITASISTRTTRLLPCASFTRQFTAAGALASPSSIDYEQEIYQEDEDHLSKSGLLSHAVLASKPWLDVTAPLQVRVRTLLACPLPLHPADAHSNQVFHLIKQLCKNQANVRQSATSSITRSEPSSSAPLITTIQSLTWAQDVLERLILDKKRRVQQMKQRQEINEQAADQSLSTFYHDAAISIKLWDLIVFAWARQLSVSNETLQANMSAQKMAPMRMEQILERALEEAAWDEEHLVTSMDIVGGGSAGDRPGSLPTVDIFNTYLYGLANAAPVLRTAHLQSQAVVQRMQSLHLDRNWHCRPNTKSYSHLLNACAKAARSHPYHKTPREQHPAYLAMEVLRNMQKAHVEEKAVYEEQYGRPYHEDAHDRNRRRIVTADAVAYTTAMQAMVNAITYTSNNQPRRSAFQREQQQFAQQILDLLKEMIDTTDGSVVADAMAFNMTLQAFAKLASSSQQNAASRKKAAQQCEEILSMRMDYVQAIQIQAENDDGGKMREQLLSDLNDHRNARMAYNICLDAWSTSGAPEAVDECERILQTMLAPDHPAVLPNTSSLNACLRAWSSSKHAHASQRAYEVVKLQRDLIASGLLPPDARPDFQTYSLLILAVAHCKGIVGMDKIQHARSLLNEMVQGMKTGTMLKKRNASSPFSSVLIAAVKSFETAPAAIKGKGSDHAGVSEDMADGDADAYYLDESESSANERIYSMALKTYEEVKLDSLGLSLKPDHHFYAAMLRVLIAAFPAKAGTTISQTHATLASFATERVSMAQSIMTDAQEAGQVSRLVVFAWTDALGIDYKEALFKLQGHAKRQMPKLWTRNVAPEFKFRGFFQGNTKDGKRKVERISNSN
ncbi:hypothetical protein MPSEU_000815400 [Mayamaea pseudoterrestris]|nr:hypothetical protein MPSEU_000815400 [Mayamaea pseudoterrestris]